MGIADNFIHEKMAELDRKLKKAANNQKQKASDTLKLMSQFVSIGDSEVDASMGSQAMLRRKSVRDMTPMRTGQKS